MVKKIVIGVVAAVVVASGAWVYSNYLAPQPEAQIPEESEEQVTQVVSATGVVVPLRWATLSFGMSGVVDEVLVGEGAEVQEGQLLVQLDRRDLELAVAEAEAALATAQATLSQVKASPRPEELAVARAGLAAAQAHLAKLQAGATEEEVTAAKGAMQTAALALQQAQAAYDEVSWLEEIGEMPQALALQQATVEYEIAKARYEALVQGASAEDIAAAQAEVDGARASLSLLSAGSRAEDAAVVEAQVAQAEVALDRAVSAVDDAALTAPFAGTIGAVLVRDGEMVSQGAPAVVLGDVGTFIIETTDLNEVDLYLLQVGQTVELTFDALPERNMGSLVTKIAPMASLEQGGTNYKVTIELEEQDPDLRWGMTAFVDIFVGTQ
ncbi:MAG TPA: efflux RND transporter periplasmic adaptor subunit [Anaerolineae bacterium]|nr:efflux RND transporter periplasmic adaptor subunit [Anaerolineae bacterium]